MLAIGCTPAGLAVLMPRLPGGTPSPPPPPAPAFVTLPAIADDGTPVVGEPLTGLDGSVTDGAVTLRQWLLNGTAIAGATGATHVPASAGDYAFRNQATGPGGSAVATSAARAVAAMPTVALSATQAQAEGQAGSVLFTYTISRSSTVGAVAIAWSFAAGTTTPADFAGGALPTGGTVALADGVASGAFTIAVAGDTLVEGDETFTVAIAAPAGYALGAASSATGTVLNDDSAPAITAIAADGWAATMAAPADLAFAPVVLAAAGFDAALGPVTRSLALATTKRIRQPFPNHAQLTADKVALSDFVYASDAIAGVDTAACPASPRPVMHWADVDRQLVGDTLVLEVTAFHRDGMAGVKFFVSDGTTTLTAIRAEPEISPRGGDQQPVIVYRAVIDVSSLASPAMLTVNAWGYPARGTAASIRKSDDLTTADADRRLFSPRLYLRNTALAAAPPLVHVAASGGNDAAGYVGPNAASAAASPCATITGALTRARAVLGTGAGALNGLRLRLGAGTHVWSGNGPSLATTVSCEVTVEAAPGVARADAILSAGASARFNLNFVRLKGITVARTAGLGSFAGATSGFHGVLDGVLLQNNGQTAALGTTAGTGLYVLGGTIVTGVVGGSALLRHGNCELRLLRGVTATPAGTTDFVPVCLANAIGCAITSPGEGTGSLDRSGSVIAFNRFASIRNVTAAPVSADKPDPGLIDGYAVVQNVFEYVSATDNPVLSLSADGATGGLAASTRHVICWHNTCAGFDLNGRSNLLYDDSSGTVRRSHTLHSFVGNLHTRSATKHDVFVGTGGNADAGNRTGGWSFLNGVGSRGEFIRYLPNFPQDYAGVGAKIGTGNTGAGLDPLFTDPRHTGPGPTAGAGGGGYALQPGSPAKGMVAASPVPYDLAGAPRGASAAAGSYA